ncbi:11482_t:CDS:2 [Scutellospora calospora]|uniref:11482_t:CDS:1 n=1 Tax=Scutellospora calospora TaxID=85575 RepID=A0ACA9KIU5_9GLOM|nr:11482_t:CDS:2 [Scutellospora calospora]
MPVHNKRARKCSAYASIETMSISALRKKIRDSERTLRMKKIHSAKGQVSLERQLKALKLMLTERTIESKEKKMISKYRMVKHFDRKKVERAIKKAEKQVTEAQTPQEKERFKQELYELQIDYNYIMGRKYMALYPKADADDPKMISRRNEIRELIREAMENNDLDSLNKRFREETKVKIIKSEENNQRLKKRQEKKQDNDANKIINDNFFGSDYDDE